MTIATHPIPQDLLNEIADLIEETKRLDPQIEELARRKAAVSERLHEYPVMTGGGHEWNEDLERDIGEQELRVRVATLTERLMVATQGSLGPIGYSIARDLGLDGFGLEGRR